VNKEPALIIAAVIAALTVVGQVLSGDLTWAAATPLLAGAIVRQFVTPAKP
jgi:hypothetical protein